jgi:oxygen-dependent protoporphyrinogen oxidase
VNRVVIVGGGISGLSTAHAVLELDPSAELVLLEQAPRVGGSIITERPAGFILDAGPDSWVATKPQATALAKRLGLDDELIGTIPENRRALIAWGDVLHPLPEGFVLGVPTSVLPIITTRLFSARGKLRMAMEPLVPRRRPVGEDDDESIDSFVRRRLGGEVAERLVAPLLGGIYGGDAAALSMRATLPQFVEMEAKQGSLIHAMKAAHRPRGAGPRPSMFTSLRSGLGTLVDRLVSKIGPERIHTDAKVARVSFSKDDPRGRFAVEVCGDEPRHADHVVLSIPAHAAAYALRSMGEPLTSLLCAMPYISTGVVMMAFARSDIAHPLNATGYIVPHVLGHPALAATWVTSKWAHRAPEDQVLIRVFLGGAGADDLLAKDDGELERLARDELERTMGVKASPRLTRVFRFLRANPQPLVGHPGRMRQTRELLAATPGLHLVASGYDGVGIPDCVRQAEQAARAIVQ